MNPEDYFSNMGFAQAGPDVWFREFTHPETGSVFSVTARIEPNGKTCVLYKRDGRLHKKRHYTRSPAVTANAVRMSVERAGFKM